MPHKKDYSAMMSTTDFWTAWEQWKPLAYKITRECSNSYPLTTIPGYSSIDDVVGYLCLETHRLGIFARFDDSRNPSLVNYLSAQYKAILGHKWQDHKRLSTRIAIPVNTAGDPSDSYDEDSSAACSSMNVIDIPSNIDPNIDWDMGYSPSDDAASSNMVTSALKTSLSSSGKPLAVRCIDILLDAQASQEPFNTTTIERALGISRNAATSLRKDIELAATALAS